MFSRIVLALLSAGLLPAIGCAASAVTAGVPSQATATVRAMAEALGHVRPVGRTDRGVGAVYFIAQGTMAEPGPHRTWTEYKVPRMVGEASYFLRDTSDSSAKSPGARWDIQRIGPGGTAERQVHVVAGQFAWNESEPGVGATPAMNQFVDRQLQLWLMPQALALAAMEPESQAAQGPGAGRGQAGTAVAATGVKIDGPPGKSVLTIPLNGTPVRVSLDADNRPERVEAQIAHPVLGRVKLEVLYSGYKDFENAYFVFFPGHIVQKLNGRTTLDLTVTEFHTNPYVVFPVPPAVVAAVHGK